MRVITNHGRLKLVAKYDRPLLGMTSFEYPLDKLLDVENIGERECRIVMTMLNAIQFSLSTLVENDCLRIIDECDNEVFPDNLMVSILTDDDNVYAVYNKDSIDDMLQDVCDWYNF
nr:MAG TPA: hypothetical protein [Caudoviricetes sp.]